MGLSERAKRAQMGPTFGASSRQESDPFKYNLGWTKPEPESADNFRKHFLELEMFRVPMYVLISTEDPKPYYKRLEFVSQALTDHIITTQAPRPPQGEPAITVVLDITKPPMSIVHVPVPPDKTILAPYENRLVFYKNGETTTDEDFSKFTKLILTIADTKISDHNKNPEREYYIEPFPEFPPKNVANINLGENRK